MTVSPTTLPAYSIGNWGRWGNQALETFLSNPEGTLIKHPSATYTLITGAFLSGATSEDLLIRVANVSRPLFISSNWNLEGWEKGVELLKKMTSIWHSSKDPLCANLISNGAPINLKTLEKLTHHHANQSLDALSKREAMESAVKKALLDYFISTGNEESIQRLYSSSRINFNILSPRQDTFLIQLVRAKQEGLALKWKDHFPDQLQHKGMDDKTLVHWAATHQLDKILFYALFMHPKLALSPDGQGKTPSYLFISRPVKQRTLSQRTLELLAADSNDIPVEEQIYRLIELGLDKKLKNFWEKCSLDDPVELGQQAALYAALFGNQRMIAFFLESILDEAESSNLLTQSQPFLLFLQFCAIWGMIDPIKSLSSHKEFQNAVANPPAGEQAPMNWAARLYQRPVLDFLHQNGGTFSGPDEKNNTLFHHLVLGTTPHLPGLPNWSQLSQELLSNTTTTAQRAVLLNKCVFLTGFSRSDYTQEEQRLLFEKVYLYTPSESRLNWLTMKNSEGLAPIEKALGQKDRFYAGWLLEKIQAIPPSTEREYLDRISLALELDAPTYLKTLLDNPLCPRDLSSVSCIDQRFNMAVCSQVDEDLLYRLYQGGMPFSSGLFNMVIRLPKEKIELLFQKILKSPLGEKWLEEFSLLQIRFRVGPSSPVYLQARQIASHKNLQEDMTRNFPSEPLAKLLASAIDKSFPVDPKDFPMDLLLEKIRQAPELPGLIISTIQNEDAKQVWADRFFQNLDPNKADLSFLLAPEFSKKRGDLILYLREAPETDSIACYSVTRKFLTLKSDFFRAAFSGTFSESTQTSMDCVINTDQDAFEKILRFLYGSPLHITHEDARALYQLSEYLQIETVQSLIRKWIKKHPEWEKVEQSYFSRAPLNILKRKRN